MRIPRFIRLATDPILENIPVTISGGVNRGRKWNLASSGSGYGNGRREAQQMALLSQLIRPGDVMWDIGAHHGYVTLCAANRVGPGGHVYAFEPSARNRRLLERHLAWNDVRNATALPWALSAADGEARFGGNGTSKMMRLGHGDEVVQTRTATTLLRDNGLRAPTFLKIDVEGAEADVLRGFAELLPRDARLFIGVHHRKADEECCALLEAAGFRLQPSTALIRQRATEPWNGDPDLFAGGPTWQGWDEDLQLLRANKFLGSPA